MVDYISSTTNNISITNGTFNNTYVEDGPGLYIFTINKNSRFAIILHITIISTLFANNNTSKTGGGLYIDSDTDTHYIITVATSTVTNNTATTGGGLYIYSYSGTDTFNNNITIATSTITNNSASTGGGVLILPIC